MGLAHAALHLYLMAGIKHHAPFGAFDTGCIATRRVCPTTQSKAPPVCL
jgi:hypothetical protein